MVSQLVFRVVGGVKKDVRIKVPGEWFRSYSPTELDRVPGCWGNIP